MATTLNPYIQFRDEAREAMTFYQDVFGGDLNVSTFSDYGDPGEADPDGVMHAQLQAPGGLVLMAADTPPGMELSPGSQIAISLSGDGEELHGYWGKLSEDGQVQVPLEKQMWGDEFGMCTDRFGITWMVNIAGSGGDQPPAE